MSGSHRAFKEDFRIHLIEQGPWPKEEAITAWLTSNQEPGTKHQPYSDLRNGGSASRIFYTAVICYLRRHVENREGTAEAINHWKVLEAYLKRQPGVSDPAQLTVEQIIEIVCTPVLKEFRPPSSDYTKHPFQNGLLLLADIMSRRHKRQPWTFLRPCDNRDGAEVRTGVYWMYVELGRMRGGKNLSIGEAISKAEATTRVSLADYQDSAVAWSKKERWTVVYALGPRNKLAGMSIVLPVREETYQAIRESKKDFSTCGIDDLLFPTSAQLLIQGIASLPAEERDNSIHPILCLFMALVCQQAYLSTVPGLFTNVPLRVLTVEGTKENAKRAKWVGYKPTGTKSYNSDVPLLERMAWLKSPALFHPLDRLTIGNWLALQLQLRSPAAQAWFERFDNNSE